LLVEVIAARARLRRAAARGRGHASMLSILLAWAAGVIAADTQFAQWFSRIRDLLPPCMAG
jgi:hypothetical protein